MNSTRSLGDHHSLCPKGERCLCYITGYTNAEYDHGHVLESLDDNLTVAEKVALASKPSRDCGNDTKRLDWLNCITERKDWIRFWSNFMNTDIREAIDAAMAAQRADVFLRTLGLWK